MPGWLIGLLAGPAAKQIGKSGVEKREGKWFYP
jgi:hypothetical protein